MAGYSPLYISGNKTGLVQDRVEHILPNDAYPILENAFVWRERIKRKQGFKFLGRLERQLINYAEANTAAQPAYSRDLLFDFHTGSEPNAELAIGTVSVKISPGAGDETIYQETSPGVISWVSGPYTISSGTINYATGRLILTFIVLPGAGKTVAASFSYYPSLPVMGIRTREINSINNEEYIIFDQVYAYRYVSGFVEYIPGTTWTGTNSDFFWSTNFWQDSVNNRKLFWVTNYSGKLGDPIRYTDGVTWTDFAPTINSSADKLNQCLCILPFRSRLVVFNTLEGPALNTSLIYTNRIRWSAIGNPLLSDAWLDDTPGKGGFLDIPTNEDIISVGFVRDNLVVYCERSTWQLRYTGKSISPFQIEKVNSELGAESTFSAVQFDTSLVGIGDKGIVQCDSFKSSLIDVKIPDLVFKFNNDNDGPKRVHGARDFIQRVAFWIYPDSTGSETSGDVFPNRRLVYNYENDSWAIFTDSFTCIGPFQPQESLKWEDITDPWEEQNYPWVNKLSKQPDIIGGNQQGFVEILDYQVSNDESLSITDITGSAAVPKVPTVIECIAHNLATGQVIKITDIIDIDPFVSLNDNIYQVQVVDEDNFILFLFDETTGLFTTPQTNDTGTYLGGGRISIRDNFNITSKKFNFLDDGQNIQLGFVDVLLNTTSEGAITMNVILDYNDSSPVNTRPQNIDPQTLEPDPFFNSIVPTTQAGGLHSTKNFQRVFCAARGAFITIQWTLSPAQMNGLEQESDVEIQAQILWMRRAGRQLPVGV